jgi:hypothetical protein
MRVRGQERTYSLKEVRGSSTVVPSVAYVPLYPDVSPSTLVPRAQKLGAGCGYQS